MSTDRVQLLLNRVARCLVVLGFHPHHTHVGLTDEGWITVTVIDGNGKEWVKAEIDVFWLMQQPNISTRISDRFLIIAVEYLEAANDLELGESLL